jgi:hypothetical protein
MITNEMGLRHPRSVACGVERGKCIMVEVKIISLS